MGWDCSVTTCYPSMSYSLTNPSWDCSCYILSLANVTVTTQSHLGLLCHLNVTLPSLRVTLQLLQLSQESLVNHLQVATSSISPIIDSLSNQESTPPANTTSRTPCNLPFTSS